MTTINSITWETEVQVRKDRRRFCGCLMPNIFFLLQVGVVLLSYSIVLQITNIFHLAPLAVYFFSLIAIGIILYCAYTREHVIERQYQHCEELAKNKKKQHATQQQHSTQQHA